MTDWHGEDFITEAWSEWMRRVVHSTEIRNSRRKEDMGSRVRKDEFILEITVFRSWRVY